MLGTFTLATEAAGAVGVVEGEVNAPGDGVLLVGSDDVELFTAAVMPGIADVLAEIGGTVGVDTGGIAGVDATALP